MFPGMVQTLGLYVPSSTLNINPSIVLFSQKDKVYYISNCTLKPANKKFSSINNDYEMSFTHSTTVIPCNEDEVGNMPSVKYCFVPLKTIAEISPDENIGESLYM